MNTGAPVSEGEQLSEIKARLLNHLRGGRGRFLLDFDGGLNKLNQVSEAQAAILALDVIAPGSAITTIGAEIRVDGHVDVDRLKDALTAVAIRHPMLRAVVAADGEGTLRLHVADAVVPRIEVCDVESSDEYRARATEFATISIDPATAPTWRVLLARAPTGDQVLIIAHHAFVDAMSMPIFAVALAEAYCHALNMQYGWGGTILTLNETESAAGTEYFRRRLAEAPRSIEWPFARALASAAVSTTNSLSRATTVDVANKLKHVAERRGITLFRLLLTLVGTTLCHLIDIDEIVFGIPVSLRVEPTDIGCFVDMFPHRFSIAESCDLDDLITNVTQRFSDDFANRATGWRKIIADHRMLGLSEPTVDVLFGTRASPEVISLEQMTAVVAPLPRVSSAAALVIEWQDWQETLRFNVDFRTDVFTKVDAELFLDMLEKVCISAAERTDLPISKIVETPNVQQWSDCDEAGFREVPSLEALLTRGLGKTTVASTMASEPPLAIGQMPCVTEYLCDQFANAGIGEGTRVALLLQRGVALPVTLVAVLTMGAVYVPLDAGHPRNRLAFIVEDADVSVIICDASTESLAREISASLQQKPTVLSVELERANTSDVGTQSRHLRPSLSPVEGYADGSLAYICYTSGSSGQPKGVAVSRKSLANLLDAISYRTEFSSKTRLLATTTLIFDIASLELLLPIAAGAELLVVDEETASDPWRLAAAISQLRPDVLQMTPSRLNLILDTGWRGHDELEIWCGGEPLPEALATKLLKCCRRLYNFYGPTETTIWSTAALLSEGKPVDAGMPISNTRIYILDNHRRLRPAGLIGEIGIGGIGVAEGYVGRTDLTAERFIDDPIDPTRGRVFLTGDRGFRNLDGSLRVLGRRDDQIKLNGHRIELGEIDTALASLPGVSAATCSPVLTPDGGLQIMAAIVGADSGDSALRANLAERLPMMMLPSRIFNLDRLPLTSNGKTDRKALAAILTDLAAQSSKTPASAGAQETDGLTVMVELFTHYTKQMAGANDDFFRLGGDSITLVRLLADVRLRFGTAPTVMTFLKSPRSPAWLWNAVEDLSTKSGVATDLAALLDEAEAYISDI